MKIQKSIGEYEEYDREKLRNSLLHASASIVTTNDIVKYVEEKLHEDITTSEIYQIAFDLLNSKERKSAMRYSVKRSILGLGPTGFPFEKFIAELFKAKSYKTLVGQMLPGDCVAHEVDVVAYDDNELILIEAKFHNSTALKTDTKVAMYIKARWDDLKDKEIQLDEGQKRVPTKKILVTNTDFTENALNYARCTDLGMISWDYPDKGSLFDLIRDTGQHPVTVITEFTTRQKELVIEKGYVTANQILEKPEILNELGFNNQDAERIILETKEVCAIE